MNRIKLTTLSLSAAALVSIAVHEGYRENAYVPVRNDTLTIGFGTTNNVKIGDKTDPVRALIRLQEDVNKFERSFRQCLGDVPLHQSEWDSLISWVYNVGPTAACNSSLVQKLKAGDYAGACKELDRWVYFQGRVLPGLAKRRAEERALCESQH
jgi:lysozyme